MFKLVYALSEKGQKKSFANGGDGKQIQEVDLEEANVLGDLRDKAVELGQIRADGSITVFVPTSDAFRRNGKGGYELDYFNKTTMGWKVKEKRNIIGSWLCEASYPVYAAERVEQDFRIDEPIDYSSRETTLAGIARLLDFAMQTKIDLTEGKAKVAQQVKELNESPEVQAAIKEAQAKVEAAKQAKEAAEKKLAAKAKARAEEKEREQAQFVADAKQWIAENGSERLHLIVEHDFLDESLNVYRDERLAQERPGWQYWDKWCEKNLDEGCDPDDVELRDVRNPSLDALRALSEEKKVHGDDVDMAFLYNDDYDVRQVVLTASFLGKDIIYALPVKHVIL
jgi:DNA-binding protein H-NS